MVGSGSSRHLSGGHVAVLGSAAILGIAIVISVSIAHGGSSPSTTTSGLKTSQGAVETTAQKSIDHAIVVLNIESNRARVFSNQGIAFLRGLSTPLSEVVTADNSFGSAYGAVIGAGLNVGFGRTSAISTCNEDLNILSSAYQRVLTSISNYRNQYQFEPHWIGGPSGINTSIAALIRASQNDFHYRKNAVEQALINANTNRHIANLASATMTKSRENTDSTMSQLESQQTARFDAQAGDCNSFG